LNKIRLFIIEDFLKEYIIYFENSVKILKYNPIFLRINKLYNLYILLYKKKNKNNK
jgi:hypothetical protein